MLSTSSQIGTVARYLADVGGDSPSDIDPTTGHGPEWGEAAPVGLLVIVLLCIALYFLVKSMNRNLKKVPESFDPIGVTAGAPTQRTAPVSAPGSTSDHAEPGRVADPDQPASPH